jgi:hypothetical protein
VFLPRVDDVDHIDDTGHTGRAEVIAMSPAESIARIERGPESDRELGAMRGRGEDPANAALADLHRASRCRLRGVEHGEGSARGPRAQDRGHELGGSGQRDSHDVLGAGAAAAQDRAGAQRVARQAAVRMRHAAIHEDGRRIGLGLRPRQEAIERTAKHHGTPAYRGVMSTCAQLRCIAAPRDPAVGRRSHRGSPRPRSRQPGAGWPARPAGTAAWWCAAWP